MLFLTGRFYFSIKDSLNNRTNVFDLIDVEFRKEIMMKIHKLFTNCFYIFFYTYTRI